MLSTNVPTGHFVCSGSRLLLFGPLGGPLGLVRHGVHYLTLLSPFLLYCVSISLVMSALRADNGGIVILGRGKLLPTRRQSKTRVWMQR